MGSLAGLIGGGRACELEGMSEQVKRREGVGRLQADSVY